jgi:hypothetical protein
MSWTNGAGSAPRDRTMSGRDLHGLHVPMPIALKERTKIKSGAPCSMAKPRGRLLRQTRASLERTPQPGYRET